MSSASERNRLLLLIGSSWRTQAIHAMVGLKLADHLAAGPLELDAIASAADADARALRRLLRALRFLGLVEQHPCGYALTTMGELLRCDGASASLADWVRWWAGQVQWDTWRWLGDAVREGAPMRGRCAPAGGYGLQAASPAAAEVFHAAMGQLSADVAPAVVAALQGNQPHGLVDVGGGRGELLAQLLQAWPQAHGALVEQEHALAPAREHLTQAGVLQRCRLLAGDFFREVPEGADVYLLKSVLHNWNDDDAQRLLTVCQRALSATARLVIVERAIDERCPAESDLRSDLNMLVSLGGRERTLRELQQLLQRCGLRAAAPLPAGEHRIFVCRKAG